jgi:ribosomal-protein-alanine N-acetyltransferase
MERLYTTNRLLLRTLDDSAAPMVLPFYQQNQTIFEPWEPTKPTRFYTLNYQASLLAAERNMASRSQSIRYFIFERTNPHEIVGTVNFYHMMRSPECSCKLGYKLAATAQHKGYAYEAISFLLPRIMKYYNLHRVEADIMPENDASIVLIKKLKFCYEGLLRLSCEIQGVRRDHCCFSFLSNQLPLDEG